MSSEMYSEESNLEQRLRLQFQKKMAGSHGSVFSSFDTYAGTLPRRVVRYGPAERVLDLYQLPFWADQQAVRTMALDFESNRRGLEGNRGYVRYATAPTASGKTASILPAFLDSAESARTMLGLDVSFSHYIYLPFDNNNRRNYRARGEVNAADIEESGAAFMLQCLERFLNGVYGTVHLNVTAVPDIENSQQTMINLLKDCAPRGRFLIHIDEHRNMINGLDEEKAARFRRGAIQTLAEIPFVVVVATYTKLLTEIDAAGSSNVCRYPVAVPLLDIDAMARTLTEFDMRLPDRPLTTTESGLLSSVRFRLAQKLSRIGLMSLHGDDEATKMGSLKQKFSVAVQSTEDVRDRLVKLLSIVKLDASTRKDLIQYTEAAKMLCGIPESHWDSGLVERQVRDMLLTPTGYVTTRIDSLLRMVDPTCEVFLFGRDRFNEILYSEHHSLLSSTPLEAAYSWVLSVRSAIQGGIELGGRQFRVQCEHLSGGRLFMKSFREDFEQRYNELEMSTFYFALEGPDSGFKQDHPLCDLFFKTADELVLVDFTAFDDAEFAAKQRNKLPVTTKRNRLIDFVKTWKGKYNEMGVTLHGVVIAPFNTTNFELKEIDGNTVSIVCGADAVENLGGLSQFWYWLAPPTNVDIEMADEDGNSL